MSDEANQFHDDWNEFLNEEERLQELGLGNLGIGSSNLAMAKRKAFGNKVKAAKDSTVAGAKKQFRTAGSTIASKVGAGHHGQLSFKDQEAAWKGMSNLPDWTKKPEEVKKQYVMANNKNLAELNDLHDWMVTLTGMAKETGVKEPLQTMSGLAYWYLGRSEVSATDKERWASLESKAKTVADAWPEDANEIELGGDGKSVEFTKRPDITSPGAIDVMILGYLNRRYNGKSYAAIEKDWTTGTKALEEALGKIYSESGILGKPSVPYEEKAGGLIGAANWVLGKGQTGNDSVQEPTSSQPDENVSESRLDELGFPKFGRKKKNPGIPRQVLAKDFILSTPLVEISSDLNSAFNEILPLGPGMKKMWKTQDLNEDQYKEAEAAYKIFQPKLVIALVEGLGAYKKFLIKLWKTRLNETFEKYVKLRNAANKNSPEEAEPEQVSQELDPTSTRSTSPETRRADSQSEEEHAKTGRRQQGTSKDTSKTKAATQQTGKKKKKKRNRTRAARKKNRESIEHRQGTLILSESVTEQWQKLAGIKKRKT